MSEPYSADLRDRVLIAYEQGEDSQVAIARRFRVCPATVSNWIRQARQEGRRCPKPHRGGPASVLVSGKQVSPPVMCRALQRLKLSVKKLRTTEQERPEIASEREAFCQHMSALPAEHLVFLDESRVTTKMARTHARAPRGQRAYGSIPLAPGSG